MMSSCPQNNAIPSDQASHSHLSTSDTIDDRESTQTIAFSTPRIIKTPVPRMRSSARSRPTSGTTSREDLDRFIPSRRRMNMELCRRKLSSSSKPRESSIVSNTASSGPASVARMSKLAYQKQLLSTLCSVPVSDLDDDLQLKTIFQFGAASPHDRSQNRSSVAGAAADPFEMDFLRSSGSCSSPKLHVTNRVISCRPDSVLDAPFVVNDFYTHPLSWSKDNVLAIALGSTVYLMNESTRVVQELVDVRTNGNSNRVKAVKWCTVEGMYHYLAVGTSLDVRIFDTLYRREVSISQFTRGSVRAFSWNNSHQWLTIGYAGGKIVNLDCRSGAASEMTRSETNSMSAVCNVAWNPEGTCLASGLNDNVVHIWDASKMENVRDRCGPRLALESHTAAIKALAWCPFRRNLLASGGGVADRCIKLWDSCSGRELRSVNTSCQVSSLLWGRNQQELYSGHGYSSNSAVVWSYPNLDRVATLSHHKDRILSMDLSPDGSKMASIGVDECVCIWKRHTAPARSGASFFSSPSFGPRFGIR